MNKNYVYRNVCDGLNDCNIKKLTTTRRYNVDNDDEIFETILKGVETIMSEKIWKTMYDAMRIVDESNDVYYVVQWTNEPYTLQDDKSIKVTHNQ